ncbi:MAG: hypothetical protein GX209_09270 [Epulopiscium sp.]|nr:hypothetical protein [Candidatus Epulonipiscium sp.]
MKLHKFCKIEAHFSRVYIWMYVGTVEVYRKGKMPKEKNPTVFRPGCVVNNCTTVINNV